MVEQTGTSVVVLSIVLPYFGSIIVRAFREWACLASIDFENDFLIAVGLISTPLSLTYNQLGS
jgi:ABC-type spermidine/putrescine transport system permease subunit I